MRFRLVPKPKRFWLSLILLGLALLATACRAPGAGPTGEAIEIEALPAGLGRGFAEVLLADGGITAPDAGDPAPAFYLQLDEQRYVDKEGLRGRPVLLNFWATWCGPCRAEMPDIVAAAEAEDDLIVLAVNVQEEMKAIEPFVQEFQMSMPVVRDAEGDLRNAFGVTGMPTSIFIDRDGNVSAIWRGLLDSEILTNLLSEIL